MSVLVIGRFKADRADLEAVFAARKDDFLTVQAEALSKGVRHHRFGVAGDEVFIIDEWDDAATFHEFFESNELVPQLMADAKAGPPSFDVIEIIDSPDAC